tara:strand:- start:59 stop:208 length:150 start_codon:yes stop_codon:yes gene_type:complete
MDKWNQLKKRIEERQEIFRQHRLQLYLCALVDVLETMKEIEHSKKEIGE